MLSILTTPPDPYNCLAITFSGSKESSRYRRIQTQKERAEEEQGQLSTGPLAGAHAPRKFAPSLGLPTTTRVQARTLQGGAGWAGTVVGGEAAEAGAGGAGAGGAGCQAARRFALCSQASAFAIGPRGLLGDSALNVSPGETAPPGTPAHGYTKSPVLEKCL